MIVKPRMPHDVAMIEVMAIRAKLAASRLWDAYHAAPTDRAALRRAAAAEAIQERLEARVKEYGRALGWFVVE